MTALALAPVYAQIAVVATESVLIATGVLVLYASIWGFKVLKRAL